MDALLDKKRIQGFLTRITEITGFNFETGDFTPETMKKLTENMRRTDLIEDAKVMYEKKIHPVVAMRIEDPAFLKTGRQALKLCHELTSVASWYAQASGILNPQEEDDVFLTAIRDDAHVITLKLYYLEAYLEASKDGEERLSAVEQLHVGWLKHAVRTDQTLIRTRLMREQLRTKYEKANQKEIILDALKDAGPKVLRFKRTFGTPEKPFYMVMPYPAVVPDNLEDLPDLPEIYGKLQDADPADLEMDADGVLNWKPGIKDENGKELREQWQPDIHSGILLKGMPEGDPPGSWKVFKVQDLSDPIPELMQKYYRNLMLKYFGPEKGK